MIRLLAAAAITLIAAAAGFTIYASPRITSPSSPPSPCRRHPE